MAFENNGHLHDLKKMRSEKFFGVTALLDILLLEITYVYCHYFWVPRVVVVHILAVFLALF